MNHRFGIYMKNVSMNHLHSMRPNKAINTEIHYSDVMGAIASQITSLPIASQPFIQAQIKKNKTSKLCITRLCAGNSPVTGELPAQRASNAKNVSIWWRHHATIARSWLTGGCMHSVVWKPRGSSSKGYTPPETLLKLKYRKIAFVCYVYLSCQII